MPKCAPVSRCWRRGSQWFPARISLAVMTMLGLVNVYMVRVNLSVAIVAMSPARAAVPVCRDTHDPGAHEALATAAPEHAAWHANTSVSPALLVDPEEEEQEKRDVLDWDEWIQGQIHSAFFYGYCISQVSLPLKSVLE
ncbi:Sialin [Chionoecetes opilio]|uniref:Sialin n=1 Tax=Chionoecetes opilio TaxID=41210 RepID=A0A8J4XLQ5_CHIOP|nr:Sialin [Chionoecetes opilio]